jgi:two-component system chemotaxis response regulator CheB
MVVVGASAGGVEALSAFVRALPADFPAPVAVVLHLSPTGFSVLADILDRAGPLTASAVEDDLPLADGRIYVARPDRHIAVTGGRVATNRGPKENGLRPAIDPLFRGAAQAFGSSTVAVVLSGTRDDGTLGAVAVKAAGGKVYAQDPDDALYRDMPVNVAASVELDGIGTPAQLAALVDHAVRAPHEPDGGAPVSRPDSPDVLPQHRPGEPGASGWSCPACGGALWLDEATGQPRFTCHERHVYSVDALATQQELSAETALWSAVRRLDEHAALLRRMDATLTRSAQLRARLQTKAREAEEHARLIRAEVLRAGEAAA